MRRLALMLLLGAAAAPTAASAADRDIGVSAIVVNQVHVATGTDVRVLRVGDRVFQNERIETGPDARAQLIFLDETTITVGPNSAVVLDTFVYDPDRQRHSVVIDATRGVLRFVSGSGDSRAFEIRTPVATVGVRGTILDILVGRDGATTVMVVEGAGELRALGSGRAEQIDRIGYASTVATRQSIPTPAAPPSAAVRNQLRALSPTAGRQLANVGDVSVPSIVDHKSGTIIDGTLPAEVIRDQLRSPSAASGLVPGRPADDILAPPRQPGVSLPSTPPKVVTGSRPLAPLR
ncbi:MAG: FecR domain-containing protein [Alphaproteobacteria bacterium]|nr:FecR domain-containing protein [Alphaproteobacteria bacterium]